MHAYLFQKRRRKPFTSRSNTLLRTHRGNSATELSSRPCAVVSPTKAAVPAIPRDNWHAGLNANIDDALGPNGSRTANGTFTGAESGRDAGTPDTFPSYSSIDSNDIHVNLSECGSSTCSESNSDTSLPGKRKGKLSTPMKPLTDEEFRHLLASPVVTPLHDDVRMSRVCASQSVVADGSVVREYAEPSVVDSCHDKIYGGYHAIVPSLQPYTKPIIYVPKD